MRIGSGALLLGLLVATMAQAEVELYRYENHEGVMVLDRQGVPPEYVAKGYEVLNERGRVIRVVPRAPTAEERRQQEEAARQAQADAQLRQRYASLADLEQSRAHRLRNLEAFVAVNHANLQNAEGQLGDLERQAAERQRAGQPLAPTLLQQIDELRADRARLEGELQRLNDLRRALEAEFASDRARLEQLLGAGG